MAIKDNPERLQVFCDSAFRELCTPAEMAEICGIDESTIRQAIRRGRLKIGQDCYKFGKQWLLSAHAFTVFSPSHGFEKVSEIKTEYQRQLRKGWGLE